MKHRGLALLELLLVLTMLGIVGTITLAMISGAGRAARRATQALAVERSTGSLAALLRHDARTALLTDWDLNTPGTLRYRRPVGGAPICSRGPGTVSLRRSAWLGSRTPVPDRDEALLLSAPSRAWVTAAIATVTPASCPDGEGAWRLSVAGAPPDPVHALVLEPVRLAAYAGSGGTWLGLAGPGDPMQPFAGPLAPAGLRLAISGGALEAALTPRDAPARTLRIPVPVP